MRFDPPIPIDEFKRPKPLNVIKPQPSKSQTRIAAPKSSSAQNPDSAAVVLDDILGAIIPPREYTENGQKVVQLISSQPSNRLEVIHLQEVLDNRLIHRQARESGICPVRSSLYADVFDELIRQITIGCPERGLLLLRLRDEARMTMRAHKALFETSVAFGARKAAVAETGLPEMRTTIRRLEHEKAELEAKVQELLHKIDAFEKSVQEERIQDEKKHGEEVSYYRKTNQQLSTHLKTETEKANSKK